MRQSSSAKITLKDSQEVTEDQWPKPATTNFAKCSRTNALQAVEGILKLIPKVPPGPARTVWPGQALQERQACR